MIWSWRTLLEQYLESLQPQSISTPLHRFNSYFIFKHAGGSVHEKSEVLHWNTREQPCGADRPSPTPCVLSPLVGEAHGVFGQEHQRRCWLVSRWPWWFTARGSLTGRLLWRRNMNGLPRNGVVETGRRVIQVVIAYKRFWTRSERYIKINNIKRTTISSITLKEYSKWRLKHRHTHT